MAAGVYSVSVPNSGWSADIVGQLRLDKDAVEDVADMNKEIAAKDKDGPFHATDSVYIEVRPTTGTLYGKIDAAGVGALDEVTVTVNGVEVETDIDGRYIAPDYRYIRSHNRHLYI